MHYFPTINLHLPTLLYVYMYMCIDPVLHRKIKPALEIFGTFTFIHHQRKVPEMITSVCVDRTFTISNNIKVN